MLYEVENMSHQASHEELDSILAFAMNYLEFDTDIPLLVSFEVDHGDQMGFIEVDEDEVLLAVNPTLSGEQLARTIFHELVHANQILSNAYDPCTSTWYGEVHTGDYWSLPWEVEAYAVEDDMFSQYNK